MYNMIYIYIYYIISVCVHSFAHTCTPSLCVQISVDYATHTKPRDKNPPTELPGPKAGHQHWPLRETTWRQCGGNAHATCSCDLCSIFFSDGLVYSCITTLP